MTSIAVYGAGGVGAYFGGRLARAGADVSLIARGEHLAALREEGLRVESVHGDFAVDLAATDDPSDIGHVDYVLVCVKSFDTGTLDLDPLVGEDTCVISLQNGVRNERLLAEAGSVTSSRPSRSRASSNTRAARRRSSSASSTGRSPSAPGGSGTAARRPGSTSPSPRTSGPTCGRSSRSSSPTPG